VNGISLIGPTKWIIPGAAQGCLGLAFAGAQLRPPVSWNPGETYAITIAFYPDAFSAMTGLDLSPFTGLIVPAEEVLPKLILEPCRAAFDAVLREGTVSERDLQGLGHSEQLYAKLHEALQKGDVDWAGLAAVSGFADQAHMIRRMRRHTGFTPEQLRQSASSDEAFWGYRLLGQYFTNPSREAAISSALPTGSADSKHPVDDTAPPHR